MAQILSSTCITSSMQRIVECPSGYIIQGHYYDKSTLSPHPFDTYNMYGSLNDLMMNQNLMNRFSFDGYWGKSHGSMIIRDNYYPEVFYVWSMGSRGNFNNFWKLKENKTNVETVGYVGVNPTSYSMPTQYAGQDATYIYYLMTTGNQGNSYLTRINKTTLTVDNPGGFGVYTIPSLLRETSQYIYIGYSDQYGGTYIKRFNKTNSVWEDCKAQLLRSGNSTQYGARICDPVKLSDTSDYTYSIKHDSTAGKMYIQKYLLDYSKADPTMVITEAPTSITWNETFSNIKVLPNSYAFKYDLFITTSLAGNKYLNISVSNISGASNTANLNDLGIYTFLIDQTTRDLTFKGFCQISTSALYRGFLGINNNTFLMATTDIASIFVRFNETSEYFVSGEIVNNQPYYIGFDQSGTMFTVNGANEVEMISPLIPKDILIQFETTNYKYQGTDINSYITIEAKNYNGSYVETTFNLSLTGNVVFTSNNSQQITETTITTGPKMIPITIKGHSNITLHPQLVL